MIWPQPLPIRKRRPLPFSCEADIHCTQTIASSFNCLSLSGFRPGSRGPFVSTKGPKTIDTQFARIRLGRRGNWRADQLAEPAPSLVEGLTQGPPAFEERPPMGPNSRRRLERKSVQENLWEYLCRSGLATVLFQRNSNTTE